jgi:hypothetical protein
MPKNVIQFLEFGNLALKQQHLIFRGDDFDASIHVKIVHDNIYTAPTTRGTLENLEIISQVTQQPIEKVTISVLTTENLSHYQELVGCCL